MTIEVQNLKCGGCSNTIKNKLESLPFLKNLEVDVEAPSLRFEELSQENLALVKKELSEMGYPEVEDSNSLGLRAKSYISCAKGRFL